MILVFSVCLMFVDSWELALITLVSAPLSLLICWGFNKSNRKYQRGIMESSTDLEAQLVESLNSISTDVYKRQGLGILTGAGLFRVKLWVDTVEH